jgi:trigger factor
VSQLVTAQLSELPESRVSLACEVLPEALDRSVAKAARELGQSMKMPGFRKGKVPAAMIIQRIGREGVIEEAIRLDLPVWYAEAIAEAGIEPIGDPSIQIGQVPSSDGQPLPFTVEVGVLPKATLGDYLGLEVKKEELDVSDERIEEEVERLREQTARLEPTEDPAADKDTVVMNYVGSVDGEEFEGGTGNDQLIELGSGGLIPGFEEQLLGAAKGDKRTINVTFPDDYGAEHLAGKDAVFEVEITDVRAKRLADLDDAFAGDVGYDSLEELRKDIRDRMTEAEERRVATAFREACVDAAAAKAKIDLPDAIVEGRASEMWERTLRSLAGQGISREIYMQISGKTEEEVLAEAKPDAEQGLRREATIKAIVAAESISPTDEQFESALEHSAEHEGVTPAELLAALKGDGRIEQLAEELAAKLAVDLVEESAKPVPAAKS